MTERHTKEAEEFCQEFLANAVKESVLRIGNLRIGEAFSKMQEIQLSATALETITLWHTAIRALDDVIKEVEKIASFSRVLMNARIKIPEQKEAEGE